MKKYIDKIFLEDTDSAILQFIRYFFIGGIAAVVNIAALYVFTDIFNIYYVLANVIAFLLGLTVNYLLSKKFVFTKSSMNKVFEVIMYVIIGVLGLVFDTFMLWIFTSKLRIYYMISKVISTMLTFVWNFVARKVLYKVFK